MPYVAMGKLSIEQMTEIHKIVIKEKKGFTKMRFPSFVVMCGLLFGVNSSYGKYQVLSYHKLI